MILDFQQSGYTNRGQNRKRVLFTTSLTQAFKEGSKSLKKPSYGTTAVTTVTNIYKVFATAVRAAKRAKRRGKGAKKGAKGATRGGAKKGARGEAGGEGRGGGRGAKGAAKGAAGGGTRGGAKGASY